MVGTYNNTGRSYHATSIEGGPMISSYRPVRQGADNDEDALRWREAILKLSATLTHASQDRRDLAPILMDALHYALEQLLVYGNARDLMLLEAWLNFENGSREASGENGQHGERRRRERRGYGERRHTPDRRQSGYESGLALDRIAP